MGYSQLDSGFVVRLPQHHLGRERVNCQAVLSVEQPVLQPAQRRDLVVKLNAFAWGQHQAGGVGVEESQRHIGPIRDVAQIFQNAWLAGALEVRGQDVADVDAEFLGVQCQFDTLLGSVGAGHHLNESPGLDAARLLHGDPNDLLELVGGQRPELGDAAGEPDAVLVQIDQAVSHQRT